MPDDSPHLTVRELRRRWKPHKHRLNVSSDNHPTAIRFHRACSWLSRAEKLDAGADADLVLINQWIGFNSLYGRWDATRRDPLPDRECWKEFVDRVLALDESEFVVGAVCAEIDGSDTSTVDGDTPLLGDTFFYLIRAENGCPGTEGQGPLGDQTGGTPRTGRDCN